MKILISFGFCILLPKGERLGHIYLLFHIVNFLKVGTISFHLILFGNKPGKNSRISELEGQSPPIVNTLFTDPHTT